MCIRDRGCAAFRGSRDVPGVEGRSVTDSGIKVGAAIRVQHEQLLLLFVVLSSDGWVKNINLAHLHVSDTCCVSTFSDSPVVTPARAKAQQLLFSC